MTPAIAVRSGWRVLLVAALALALTGVGFDAAQEAWYANGNDVGAYDEIHVQVLHVADS